MVVEIAPRVYWVGVVDWDIRRFHGHELSTHRGTSYNAYLILDEKIALVDTVAAPFAGRLLESIRELVDPARIDYVIANHAELDHAGALPEVMREAPQASLIVSRRGAESIPGHHHRPWPIRAVRTGERLSLGQDELLFVEAPMLHWPDSMFTYLAGRRLLMPNDAFGQHYAAGRLFNDEVDGQELLQEARKYYANILTPFSAQVLKKIDELLALELPVSMIAPSHGVLWREDPLQIVRQYQAWARQEPQKRAVIVQDTMWGATTRLAEAIGDGLTAEGVPYKIFHAAVTDRNDVLAEVLGAGALVVGSPTINQGMLGTITVLLEDLAHLKFHVPIGGAFGSYGWGGESVKAIAERLAACGLRLPADPLRVQWQPRAEDLAAAASLGRAVGAAVREL
ncbi:MAG: MBL fold metallo-hydrolase [Candidatus Eisenbacteria bacterium]|uniref:MBL fold metallo-hydrolase n=1 Tax=Eiseniibacteriota bacterium TaxID=2212470 RepID=A0A937XBL0_UNCEI|nr:MBL fold metallo-hydrolase [Candidatus Eisenbacteria bacterium]